jgi:putative ABC transport system permease protein
MSLLLTAVRLAFGAIARNKMRAALTVLGILIGVAAVMAVMALANGATFLISDQLDGFGANMIVVIPRTTQQSGARAKSTGRLTEADGRVIAREAVSVAGVGFFLQGAGQVIAGDKNVSTVIVGVNLAYFPIRKYEVAKGALWEESDEILKTKVCVIGNTVSEKLFGTGFDPTGQTVRIGSFPYRIVGLLKSRGAATIGQDQDDRILMPTGSFRGRVQHTAPGRIDQLVIGASSAETTDRAKAQITSILRQRHRIPDGGEADFDIRTQAQLQETVGSILGVLSLLLMGVAAISLLVGGIGVMNIMLVSVAERTREIGTRMSIGARERDILLQFLVEAVVLSLLGGVMGILLGTMMTVVLAFALDWPLHPSLVSILLAVGTSAAIGLVFGFLPARRAAKLDPIEALRVE